MALPVSDAFTSASDQLLTTYSASYSNVSNAFTVLGASDDVYQSSGVSNGGEGGVRWNADTFNNDQYASIKLSAVTVSNLRGPAVRCSSSAVTYYGFYADNNEHYLFKMVAGTWTQIGSTDTTNGAVNDVLRLEVSGTTLTPKRNGSTWSQGAKTDSSISSGYGGMCGYGTSTSTRMDDFAAGNLGGTAYNQSVSGAISTLTGAAVKRDNKVTAGALATITGAILKRGNKVASGAVSTISGTVSKRLSRALSGAVATITGALTSAKSFLRSLSGAVGTITGGLAKQDNKVTSGAVATISGTVSKRLSRALSGAVSTISGTVTSIRSILRSLSGAVGTITGGLVKRGNKVTSGAVSTISGTVSKRLSRALSGAVSTISGTVTNIRNILRSLSGAVGTITGGLVKRGNKAVSGELLAISGGLVKRMGMALSGAVSTITGILATLGSNDIVKAITGAVAVIAGALQILIIRGGASDGFRYPRKKRSTLDDWDDLDGLVRKRNGKWK